jgi:predicted aconitase with swiveling domain
MSVILGMAGKGRGSVVESTVILGMAGRGRGSVVESTVFASHQNGRQAEES